MKKFFSRLLYFAFVLVIFFEIRSPIDAAGSLYLSPRTQTVAKNATLSVSVRMNSGGDQVNAVQANLTYSADKLDFISISSAGSSFPIDAASAGGSGTVSISRGVIGTGISGDKLIATVRFRVNASAQGSAAINFSGGSALVRGSDQANILGGSTGGNYTIGAAVAASASTPAASIPLQITNVSVTDLSYNTATIEWKTSRPASSVVEYGVNTKYGLEQQVSGTSTTHKVVLSSDILTPGVIYHYKVKSTDALDIKVESADYTFTTKGLTVNLNVQDEQGGSLSNRNLVIITPQGEIKEKTDDKGIAQFQNMAPATYVLLVENGGKQYSKVFTVNAPTDEEIQSNSVPPQNITVLIAGIKSNSISSMLPLIALTAGVVVLSAFAIFFILRRRNA